MANRELKELDPFSEKSIQKEDNRPQFDRAPVVETTNVGGVELSLRTKEAIERIKKSGDYGEINYKELHDIMDEYAVKGIHLLWRIVTDPDHEWHKRFGFEALRVIMLHCVPKRREIAAKGDIGVGLSLPDLFKQDTLSKKRLPAAKEKITDEIEVLPIKESVD